MKRSWLHAALVVVIIAMLLFTSFIALPAPGSLRHADAAGPAGSASTQSISNSTSGSYAVVMNSSIDRPYREPTYTPAFYTSYLGGGGYNFGAVPTATDISYPMTYPSGSSQTNGTYANYLSIFQNVTTYLPPYMYQGNSQYDAEFANSLHWVANFTRIYPPAVYKNYGEGTGPNYSLQFNVYFYSSLPGGEGEGWYQSAFGFYTVTGAGNTNDGNASYFLMPGSEWWLGPKVYVQPYSFNYSPYNNLFVNPENPLVISSWLNISAVMRSLTNGSVFIMENDRVTGLLAKGYQENIPYADHSYRTVWFNTTFEIINGSKYGVDPFPLFRLSGGGGGLAFVGSGNGQVVWGNYTATFGVAEYVNGVLLPMSGVEGVQSGTGESSIGDEGVVILGSKTNPVSLPPYFPYTYNSNQSGGPLLDSAYNANHEAAASSVIVGNVYPASAGIKAYAVYTHSYIPVVKNGSSFYVDFPGLYGMNSSEILIGQLSLDYWSPIILNFSAPGFQNVSVEVVPYREVQPFVEVRSVWAVLRPVSEKMVYGFISFPLSYFSYFAERYVSEHYPSIGNLYGSIEPGMMQNVSQAQELLRDIWAISSNASSYFWLDVSGGGAVFNESWYLPYVIQILLKGIWENGWSETNSAVVWNPTYNLLMSGGVEIPYSLVLPSASSSVDINAPLLSGNIPVSSGPGAFEVNISMNSLTVPLSLDLKSIPVVYNGSSPWISSVSVDGRTVWSGNSGRANVTLQIPLGQIAAIDPVSVLDSLINRTLNVDEPSFYYNVTIHIIPLSPQYAPVNVSRNIMAFNYSLAALASRYSVDSANLTQVIPFSFPQVRIGMGGGYYAIVEGKVYGIYNTTGQRFVLGGVTLQFLRDGTVIGNAITSTNGSFEANLSLGPASVWGYNESVAITVSSSDYQFRNFSGILWLHAKQVEWFNVSMIFIQTVNVMGYNLTIPAWFVNVLLTFALGATDFGFYAVILYFGMIAGIGIAGAVGGGGILLLIGRRMLKIGASKGAAASKDVMNKVKPGNK